MEALKLGTKVCGWLHPGGTKTDHLEISGTKRRLQNLAMVETRVSHQQDNSFLEIECQKKTS